MKNSRINFRETSIVFGVGLFALMFLCQPSVYGQTLPQVKKAPPSPTAKPVTPQVVTTQPRPTVPDLPDLLAKQIQVTPGSLGYPKKGFKVLVANIGKADASSSFLVHLVAKRFSGGYGDEDNVWQTAGPLAKGKEIWVEFPYIKLLNDNSPNGITSIVVQVDAKRSSTAKSGTGLPGDKVVLGPTKTEGPFVKESNEKNNFFSPNPKTILP